MSRIPQDEHALRRYRKLVESMPDSVVYIVDREWRVVAAGGALARSAGFQTEMHVGRRLADLVPAPDMLSAITSHLEATFGGQETSFEFAAPLGRTYLVQMVPLQEDGDGVSEVLAVGREISERKQALKTLAENEARYRSLFENNSSVMLLIDPANGAILDANKAAETYYGWKQSQLRAMNVFDIDTSSVEQVDVEAEHARSEGRSYYLLQHRKADGTLHDVEVYSSPIQVNGLDLRYVIVHDITERKRAQEALAASESALKRSQAMAHIGHWIMDSVNDTLIWSDEMRRILGVEMALSSRNLDQVLRQAVHPEDLPKLQGLRRQLHLGDRPGSIEFRVVLPDGRIRYIAVNADEPEWDAAGGVLRHTGVMQDITEQKLRENEREQLLRQLQSTAEQLAQVVHSAPEGVLLLDHSNRVVLANKRANAKLAVLAAYDAEERLLTLGGVKLEELLATPDRGQWHTLQARQRTYELIARPVESGPLPAGWVMIVRDVTTERAVQEQLQRQERLAAVGQLAAGIAHDFNNIMSVISIYAEMTSEAPGLTDKERSRTLTIIEQAQRATRLIRQILDFSRQSVFQRQVLDLLPLLKEEAKLLRQTLPESVEIRLDYRPGEYLVLADPTRIQQLVMNLALNSRDAMPEGGRLTIELSHTMAAPEAAVSAPQGAAGTWVHLLICDTGTGIAAEHMPHIFEPFFTTKEPGKGTGLGLAQVHGIVAQHDGYVTVSSVGVEGTCFSVFLPALATPVPSHSGGLQPALPLGHGKCVLVVEDNDELRDSLEELLEGLDYRVAQAANGEEALAVLAQAQPDLILSDVVMPRLGGAALLKLLRQRGVQTPVILMSGHPLAEERAVLDQLGMAAWLDKPPDRRRLAQAIAGALGQIGVQNI